MNIQSNFGLKTFQGASKTAPSSQAVYAPASGGPSASAAAQRTSEKVTISEAAMALAASEGGSAPARAPGQERFLQTLRDNTPAESDKIAYELATSRSEISYDISHGDIRLSSTGEVAGEGYAEKFSQLATAVDAQKRALYDSEKAKGTDPKEIIAKIIDFQNSQSQAYRDATGAGFS